MGNGWSMCCSSIAACPSSGRVSCVDVTTSFASVLLHGWSPSSLSKRMKTLPVAWSREHLTLLGVRGAAWDRRPAFSRARCQPSAGPALGGGWFAWRFVETRTAESGNQGSLIPRRPTRLQRPRLYATTYGGVREDRHDDASPMTPFSTRSESGRRPSPRS
jgi:hypothetical protein